MDTTREVLKLLEELQRDLEELKTQLSFFEAKEDLESSPLFIARIQESFASYGDWEELYNLVGGASKERIYNWYYYHIAESVRDRYEGFLELLREMLTHKHFVEALRKEIQDIIRIRQGEALHLGKEVTT